MSEYTYGKKPRRVRYHFGLVLLVTIAIFGTMFYQYMNENTLEDVLAQQSEQPSTDFDNEISSNENEDNTQTNIDDEIEETPFENPVPMGEMKSKDYLNDCIFVGDFITYGLATHGIVPSSNVYSSVSMSISKIETAEIETEFGKTTVLDALSQKQPHNIYLMLGSNGAAFMSVNDMYQSFSSFMSNLTEICPESKIYILSVPPVTSEKEISIEAPILNSDLDKFNEKLLEYANRNDMYYVDINSVLKGESGCLTEEDAEKDGLHLKSSAYNKIIDTVLSHMVD